MKTRVFHIIITFILFIINSHSGFGQTCNNWGQFPAQPSYIRVGDLDIPGNKITVEALVNRTAPWNGIDLFQGDVVSKHEDVSDCNYVLRPSSAEITTTNGYYKTPTICPIQLNKTYHIAFTYDGATLKFYRNGFLMSQIEATGDLIQNNWQTQIGLYYNQITQENLIGFINEVKIWNVVRTQAEIKSAMVSPLQNPQSIPGLLAYYTFDDLKNKQGNARWDGKIGGGASINKVNPACNLVIDSCNIVPCQNFLQTDFDYEQDICNPKLVRFTSTQNAMSVYEWNFGNGLQSSGDKSKQVTYQDFGIYTVTLNVQSAEGCKGTVTKNITVDWQPADVIVTKDTMICAGDGFALRSNPSLIDFCWQSSDGSVTGNVVNPVVKPSVNTTFTLTSKSLKANLVMNGDFSSGYSAFQSDYTFSANGFPEGVFYVSDKVTTWHSGLAACSDRTTQSGNMLMINGSAQQNQKVWYQTVNVKPHTNYVFSAWIQSLSPENPAQLQFSINDNKIGNGLQAGTRTCQWTRFYNTWNSGDKTTASIAIVNVNQALNGNDFALDDIFFGEVVTETESINVTVAAKPALQLSADTLICESSSVQLSATGAFQYEWQPAASLSASNVANPVARPTQTTRYYVTGTAANGCFKKDSVEIQVRAKPNFSIHPLTTSVCMGDTVVLSIQGGTDFEWVANPSLIAVGEQALVFPKVATQYKVTVRDKLCAVDEMLTTLVDVKPLPVLTITKSNDIDCSNTTAQLQASGGTQVNWLPAIGLQQTATANPVVTPIHTTTFVATLISADGCLSQDSITVNVTQTGINRFYVPNAFTPDGNGKNDCFGVPFWGQTDQFSFDIYNRWGQRIFSTKKVSDCWDGKYNGQLQPEGVYVYRITAKTFCGAVVKNGTVLLTR